MRAVNDCFTEFSYGHENGNHGISEQKFAITARTYAGFGTKVLATRLPKILTHGRMNLMSEIIHLFTISYDRLAVIGKKRDGDRS